MTALRINSLDQFRGYTIVGMVLVNYLGKFAVIDPLFKHKLDFCSYADTIMPQFFFCVGFALRLVMVRRLAEGPAAPAYWKAVKRCLGLFLLGIVYHHLEGNVGTWNLLVEKVQTQGWHIVLGRQFERNVFQTLVHIAVTSLWLLPVIGLRTRWLVCWLLLSAGLHVGLSHWFYFDWAVRKQVIDGGPLGFLSWSIPTLWGALAFDAFKRLSRGRLCVWLLAWGVLLMVIGYSLSCLNAWGSQPPRPWLAPLPFQPPDELATVLGKPRPLIEFWTMSQRTGSISYQTFSAGLSLFLLMPFVLICDGLGWQLPLFRTLGQNPLAAYLIHGLCIDAAWPLVPADAPLWYVLTGFAAVLGLTWLFTRYLEKQGIYLRL